jgi:transcriptional regulator with XRE-family HTH domain
MLVDAGDDGETRSQAVTRRVREELARKGLSVSAVARLAGESQQKLSRRMTGSIPWDVDELDEFCRVAGISYEYVTTGYRALPEQSGHPHPGPRRLRKVPAGESLPWEESNLQPFGWSWRGNVPEWFARTFCPNEPVNSPEPDDLKDAA